MLNQEQALELFKKSGALLEGHFILTSGRHSNRYIQCAQVLRFPEYSSKLCSELAGRFKGEQIDLVVGPAVGGILVAYEVSRHLGVPNIFTERENGLMTLRRGFAIDPGQKVLVVEDVTTTGGSVKEVINLVTSSGGKVVGVGTLIDRSGGQADFGVKKEAVITLEVPSWEPQDCPLCAKGDLAIKPGSRGLK
jgi:orotate phosphoribosyltransferase